MAININSLVTNNQVKQTIEQQSQVKQIATQTSTNIEQAKQVRTDSVSITPQAKQLSELQKKASSGHITDQKNIEQLKKAIAAGEYKVDADKLVKNMLAFEFDLFAE
ncbi:MAG: flagellar biosynthesis anti-sigma factor FlgM [Alteromonadaceae bacterium]|nr:flagellar biosynthesis anti-sigma factor FlgM [Alteromonadaceae bacterium]